MANARHHASQHVRHLALLVTRAVNRQNKIGERLGGSVFRRCLCCEDEKHESE